MARTVKVGQVEMKVRKQMYDDGTNSAVIETDKVAVVIRDDGTVHIMNAVSVVAYDAGNNTIRIECI